MGTPPLHSVEVSTEPDQLHDIEPDNDHTDTPTTTSIGGLFCLSFGWVFDSTGGFNLLYVWLGSAAIVAATAGALLPGRRRRVPAGAD